MVGHLRLPDVASKHCVGRGELADSLSYLLRMDQATTRLAFGERARRREIEKNL
jgi:hypothetical protein